MNCSLWLSIFSLGALVLSLLFISGMNCRETDKVFEGKKLPSIVIGVFAISMISLTLLTTFSWLILLQKAFLALYLPFITVRHYVSSKKKTNALSKVDYSIIIVLVLVVDIWLVFPSTLFIDIATCAIAFQLLTIMVLPIRVAFAIASFIVLHDVLGVYGTKKMVNYVFELSSLPVVLYFPMSLSVNVVPQFIWGLGDIMFPGIVVMSAFRFAKDSGIWSIAWAGLCGYAFGLCLAIIAVFITNNPQPATLYLCPSTIAACCLAAMEKKVFRQFLGISCFSRGALMQ